MYAIGVGVRINIQTAPTVYADTSAPSGVGLSFTLFLTYEGLRG